MDFIIVDILLRANREHVTMPISSHNLNGLYNLVVILNESKNVIAFKVTDECLVTPKHFGWAENMSKWVLKFTEEMYGE